MTERFAIGSTVLKREVLAGRVWMEYPVEVVVDDGTELAALLRPGTPLIQHDHPIGPHPWSAHPTWGHQDVLQIFRPDSWYSVWKCFSEGVFTHWYVNFDEPFTRVPDGFATHDLALDLIIEADGTRRWKDVQDLAPALAGGFLTADELGSILEAAAELWERLERDDRWWSAWDDWVVPPG